MSDPTLNEALQAAGYTTERVVRQNGEWRGMRILKDGCQVHETDLASAEKGWEIALAKASA
jgi:hypothetical protein